MGIDLEASKGGQIFLEAIRALHPWLAGWIDEEDDGLLLWIMGQGECQQEELEKIALVLDDFVMKMASRYPRYVSPMQGEPDHIVDSELCAAVGSLALAADRIIKTARYYAKAAASGEF